MVKAPKPNLSPVTVGNHSISTKQSTWQRHQVNEGKSSFAVERVRAFGALHNRWCRQKYSVEKSRETHFVCTEVKEKIIKDYKNHETAWARKQVVNTETVITQEQEDMSSAEKEQPTTRKPDISFEEMLNAIGNSLSDLVCSDDDEDGDDVEAAADTEFGKVSKDDEPDWVMGTISKTVPHCAVSVWQKRMTLHKLNQPWWEDVAKNFCERDMKHKTSKMIVRAVGKPQTDPPAATPLPITVGEIMQPVDIAPWQSQMWQGTSRPGSSQMRPGSAKSQPQTDIAALMPDAVANSKLIENVKTVDPVSIDYHISHP